MAIVLVENTLYAHSLCASATEVLDELLGMPTTIDLTQVVKLFVKDT